MESLHEAITASVCDFRSQVLMVADQLSDRIQELNDRAQTLEVATAAAAADAAVALNHRAQFGRVTRDSCA